MAQRVGTRAARAEPGQRRGGWPLLALGAWSVLSWAGRARNIFDDADLGGGARLAWLVPAVVFILGGLLCLAAWWRGGGRLRRAVRAFALWTLGYWAFRMVLIVTGGYSAGFVAVHALLAVVAAALAVAVLGALRHQERGARPGMPRRGEAG